MDTPDTNGLTKAQVALALDGQDPAAQRLLMKRLMPCVQAAVARVAWRYGGARRQDVEDLVQQILLQLLTTGAKSLRAWDPGRGDAYVSKLVEWRTAGLFKKKVPEHVPLSDEHLEVGSGDREGDAGSAWIGSLEAMLAELHGQLTAHEGEIFEMYWGRIPADEISRRAGVTTNAVYLVMTRIRAKARAIAERRRDG